jgi:hypothetical protein
MSFIGERTKSISLLTKSPTPAIQIQEQLLGNSGQPGQRARSSNKSTGAKSSFNATSGQTSPWTPERQQILVKSTS